MLLQEVLEKRRREDEKERGEGRWKEAEEGTKGEGEKEGMREILEVQL